MIPHNKNEKKNVKNCRSNYWYYIYWNEEKEEERSEREKKASVERNKCAKHWHKEWRGQTDWMVCAFFSSILAWCGTAAWDARATTTARPLVRRAPAQTAWSRVAPPTPLVATHTTPHTCHTNRSAHSTLLSQTTRTLDSCDDPRHFQATHNLAKNKQTFSLISEEKTQTNDGWGRLKKVIRWSNLSTHLLQVPQCDALGGL